MLHRPDVQLDDANTRGGDLDYLENGPQSALVGDGELELLQNLAAPALIPTTTREFANLNHLGLIFLEERSGMTHLTPLGKAWIRTQARSGSNG